MFSNSDFSNKVSREELMLALREYISERIDVGDSFHRSVAEVVGWLRGLGHILVSIDQSNDFEVWGPDYMSSGVGLVVSCYADGEVAVEWSSAE